MEKLKNKAISALRWSEKYTKTDMTYLAKGSFWNILSQIIVSGSTFLLAIAFAHFVSKESYGEYKFVLSLAGIIGVFGLTGLGTATLQSVSKGYEGTLNYAFWKNIRWSILFFLISLGTSVYYFLNDNNSLGIALLIVGSFAPFLGSLNLYNSFLVAKKDFRRSAIYYNIIGNIFPSLCLFITLLLTDKPIWFVTTYFASNVFIGVILYIRIIKIHQPNKEIDSGTIGYSKHLSLMNILAGIADNIDQVLVFHYVGAIELAIYNFAVAIPSQIKGPMKGLAGLIFPKFAERSDEEIKKGMNNKYLILFVSGVLIILAYFLAAPYIYKIFLPNYVSSVVYSQIFSLSLLWIVAIPADTYLVVRKKIREQYFLNIFGSIIQIVLLLVGVIWGGLWGLVVARVIIQLLWSFTSIVLYEKSSK